MNMRLLARLFAVLALSASASHPAFALLCERSDAALEGAVDAASGAIFLMRHGVAPTGEAVPGKGQTLGCTETTRHLSAAGKAQVKRLGARLMALEEKGDFKITALYSSTACRTRETALALGILPAHSPVPALISKEEAGPFVENLDPGPGELIILVSHSHIIPSAVEDVRPPLEDTHLNETEAVVLTKKSGSLQCKAVLPPQ